LSNAEYIDSQLLHDDISTPSAEKTSPTPTEGYLMRRGLAAGPAPDVH
jgi:hypothetical protein